MSRDATIADVLAGRAQWCVVTGDCLQILPTIPAGSVGAVVTDPPYGLDYPYASYQDTPENLMQCVIPFVREACRVASRAVVFPGVHNVQKYPVADWICSWSWRSTSHFGKAGYSMWQPVLLYGKDLPQFGNVNGLTKTDSVHFPDGNGIGFLGGKRADHPCPKPEKVMKWMVDRFCESGGTVLDPFCGSGTTGVACMQTGRRFIGIEIDAGYCDIARRRIAEAVPTLFQPPREPDPALFGGAT